MKRSEVYRMVQEEEEEGKSSRPYRDTMVSPTLQSQSFNKLQRSLEEQEDTTSSSPSPTYMRRQPPPPQAPPKPVSRPADQRPQQYQPQPQPQHQQPQVQRQPPQQHQQPQVQYQQPQQHQQPQVQRQPPQQHNQPHHQQQQQNIQRQQNYQTAHHHVNAVSSPTYNKPPDKQPAPLQVKVASRPGPTFQSNIPVQSSAHENENEVLWTTSRRGLPVWPPASNQSPLSTSSQSVKWSGSTGPSKKFIWPPPKDYVEISEEFDGDQRRTVYTHVKDPRPNPARVIASSRDRTKLGSVALEPYSQEYKEHVPPPRPRQARPVRNFYDIIYSNSTRLPPTYRAPPGTLHMAT